MGCLREDLALADALGDITDPDLLEIITPLCTFEDPFSLLGVLEIAIARSSDTKFMAIVEKVIDRVGDLQLRRADGTDVFEIMPPIAGAILRQINTCEDGIKRPPYWRRFAAWVQAGAMIRMLAQSEVDGAEFSAWLDHSGQGAGYMRTLVDLRPEPMWSAYETTADRLRGEVLGRMFRLLNRWEHSGGTLPDTARRVLERSLSRNPEALFEACMPGPLEGHRRSESVRPLAGKLNDAVRVWSERLDGPQCRPAWAFLGQAAQALPLEETILDKIRTQVRTARISEDPQEGEIALDELTRAGIIAAVHRDQQLGDAIGQRCVLQAEKVESGGAVTAIFHSLLVAAASYSEQEQWRSWAQSKLFDVAIRLPFGQPSRSLSKRLEDLKIVMPAGDDIWSKAEGMALLAT